MIAKELYLIHCYQDIATENPSYYKEFDEETLCSECKDTFYFLHEDKKTNKKYCCECFGNTHCEIIETLNGTSILIEKKTSNILFKEECEVEDRETRNTNIDSASDALSELEII